MAPIIIATSESRSKASIPGQPENKNGLVVVPFVDERFFILSHASSNPGFIMQKVDSVLHIVNCEDPSDAQHSEYHYCEYWVVNPGSTTPSDSSGKGTGSDCVRVLAPAKTWGYYYFKGVSRFYEGNIPSSAIGNNPATPQAGSLPTTPVCPLELDTPGSCFVKYIWIEWNLCRYDPYSNLSASPSPYPARVWGHPEGKPVFDFRAYA